MIFKTPSPMLFDIKSKKKCVTSYLKILIVEGIIINVYLKLKISTIDNYIAKFYSWLNKSSVSSK